MWWGPRLSCPIGKAIGKATAQSGKSTAMKVGPNNSDVDLSRSLGPKPMAKLAKVPHGPSRALAEITGVRNAVLAPACAASARPLGKVPVGVRDYMVGLADEC